MSDDLERLRHKAYAHGLEDGVNAAFAYGYWSGRVSESLACRFDETAQIAHTVFMFCELGTTRSPHLRESIGKSWERWTEHPRWPAVLVALGEM